MTETIKLLTASESTNLPTGYAVAMKNIIERLLTKGYEIRHMAWQHQGMPIPMFTKDMKHQYDMVSGGGHVSMTDPTFPYYNMRHITEFKPDAILSLIDFWFTGRMVNDSIKQRTPYVNYFPQDCIPFYSPWLNHLKNTHTPLGMSKFGVDTIHEAVQKDGRGGWIDHFKMEYIYHGVDTSVFRPLSESEKNEWKLKLIGDDSTFCVGLLGKNCGRKQHERAFQAFAEFSKFVPDAKLLVKVGDPTGVQMQHHDLTEFATQLGIFDNIVWLDKEFDVLSGVTEEELNAVYNIMDVYMSATSGEGFGLSTIEAMATGTPVVITDYTTSEELITDPKTGKVAGDLIPIDTSVIGEFGSYRGLVNTGEMANALYLNHEDPKMLREKSRLAIRLARNFNWDEIADQFDRVIKQAIEVGA